MPAAPLLASTAVAGSRFLHVQVGDRLWDAIRERAEATDATVRDVVLEALQAHLELGDEVFQTSTIGAVMDGVYDGDVTIGHLREHGDMGIGTFDDLDGEMVMVDGTAYRIDAECAAHPADDDARTPFATVTHWVAKHTVEVSPGTQLAGLQSTLDDLMATHNYLYAVRLEGRFRSITVRSVKPQAPGTRLIDATRTQTVRTFEDCEGTVVGFYTPEFLAHVGVPGSTSTSSRRTAASAATCSRSRWSGER